MSVNERFIERESFFIFLDLHVLPERVGEVHKVIQQELWSRTNIRVHHGKTKVWSRVGVEPRGCTELTVAPRMVQENVIVRVGDQGLLSVAWGNAASVGVTNRTPEFRGRTFLSAFQRIVVGFRCH